MKTAFKRHGVRALLKYTNINQSAPEISIPSKSDQRGLRDCACAQSRQRLRYSHVQVWDIDEGAEKKNP